MQDLFERVREYYYQERGRGWEINWEPYQLETQDRWSRIAPRNKNDQRRMHVGTLMYAKEGITSKDASEALFIEKNSRTGKIQDLGAYTVYTCKVDYAVVKDIEEDGEYVGFDILLRYEPMESAAELAEKSAAQRDKIRRILTEDSAESEKQRNQIGEKLVHSIALAIQEMERVELSHGHINPDNLIPHEHDGILEFQLHVPGLDGLLKSEADDRKVMDFYSAPELLHDSSQPFDVQTDLYSMGMLLYQLLNEGNLPFESGDVSAEQAASMRSHGSEEIPLPKHGCRLLQYMARKACAYKRENRYARVTDVLEDLKHIDSKLLAGYDPMEVVTAGGSGRKPTSGTVQRTDDRALKQAHAEIETLRKELEMLKKQSASGKIDSAEIEKLRKENEELKQKNAALEKNCKDLETGAIVHQKDQEDREAALKKENAELKESCMKLQKEAEHWKSRAEQAQKSSGSAAGTDAAANAKIQELEQQLADWKIHAEKWKNHAWEMYVRNGKMQENASPAVNAAAPGEGNVTHEEMMRRNREAGIDARFEQELKNKKS